MTAATAVRNEDNPRAWMDFGACLTEDPDLFTSGSETGIRKAKAICGRCFVRADCLAYAPTQPFVTGVWGGELFTEGRIMPWLKPQCRNGHARTLFNTTWDRQGRIVCLDCQEERHRDYSVTRARARRAARSQAASPDILPLAAESRQREDTRQDVAS
jgi:WhiB family redox-sensing transcriptional regulator